MAEKYNVENKPLEQVLGFIKSGEIAIPEIQRPFVWKPIQVRDLVDSLYMGYPTGYLIVSQSPSMKLKDGTTSVGKKNNDRRPTTCHCIDDFHHWGGNHQLGF